MHGTSTKGENRSVITPFALGAKVRAHVSAPGMVLLTAISEVPLELALVHLSLNAFPCHTITRASVPMEHLNAKPHQDWVHARQALDFTERGLSVPLREHNARVLAA